MKTTMTPKTCSAIIVALLLTLVSASADQQERARILKAGLTERMLQNGWQLVNDAGLQATFQRQSGFGQTFLMNAMTGAGSTWAVTRLTATLVPKGDHYTMVYWNASTNNQNTFGQVTSVPVKLKARDLKELQAILESVQLPSKYKKVKPGTSDR